MKKYIVYWYHLSSHTNPHKEGYVGVTNQNAIRRRCHLSGKSGGSKILCQAFKKYGEQGILQDVLHTVDSKDEAYELEMAYRPHPFIGWNLAVGGGMPPDTTGRVDPPEVRRKRAESMSRTKLANPKTSHFKGMTNRHSVEARQAIGIVHRGKTISEAHKKAITEKNSGNNNINAKEVFLVHRDKPQQVHRFPCIKVAADSLGISYNTLRSQAQRTLKYSRTSEPSRTGWICLSRQDSQNPVDAVALTLSNRTARFHKMTQERENRKAQGTRVAPSNN